MSVTAHTNIDTPAGRRFIREMAKEENRVLALKEAIRLGEESGIASDFEPTTHLVKIKNQRKLNVKI